jgi:hypothetical protein
MPTAILAQNFNSRGYRTYWQEIGVKKVKSKTVTLLN